MYKTKDNEIFELKKQKNCNGSTPCYYITALSNQGKKIGELSFKTSNESYLKPSNQQRTAWLYHIWVTEEYLTRGVGHALITEFESVCKKHDIYNIEAKYSPFGAGGMLAKNFYIHHDFTIKTENYDMYILKTLSKEKLLEQPYSNNDTDSKLSNNEQKFM